LEASGQASSSSAILGLFDDLGGGAAARYRNILGGPLDAQARADAILFDHFEATLRGIHDHPRFTHENVTGANRLGGRAGA
jgi:hypothetical protein